MKSKLQTCIDKYKGKKFWMNCCFAEVTDIISSNNDKYIYVKLHGQNGIYSLSIRDFEKTLKLNGYKGE